MGTFRHGIAAVLALGVAVIPAGSARAAGPLNVPPIPAKSGGIVFTSSTGHELATVRSLKCKVTHGYFKATGSGEGGWTFQVIILHFSGFHSYDFDYGSGGDARFYAGNPNDYYSNTIKPKVPGLTQGGSIAFPHGRGKLGIAFGLAYNSEDPHFQLSAYGTAGCSYPHKRGKK